MPPWRQQCFKPMCIPCAWESSPSSLLRVQTFRQHKKGSVTSIPFPSVGLECVWVCSDPKRIKYFPCPFVSRGDAGPRSACVSACGVCVQQCCGKVTGKQEPTPLASLSLFFSSHASFTHAASFHPGVTATHRQKIQVTARPATLMFRDTIPALKETRQSAFKVRRITFYLI